MTPSSATSREAAPACRSAGQRTCVSNKRDAHAQASSNSREYARASSESFTARPKTACAPSYSKNTSDGFGTTPHPNLTFAPALPRIRALSTHLCNISIVNAELARLLPRLPQQPAGSLLKCPNPSELTVHPFACLAAAGRVLLEDLKLAADRTRIRVQTWCEVWATGCARQGFSETPSAKVDWGQIGWAGWLGTRGWARGAYGTLLFEAYRNLFPIQSQPSHLAPDRGCRRASFTARNPNFTRSAKRTAARHGPARTLGARLDLAAGVASRVGRSPRTCPSPCPISPRMCMCWFGTKWRKQTRTRKQTHAHIKVTSLPLRRTPT